MMSLEFSTERPQDDFTSDGKLGSLYSLLITKGLGTGGEGWKYGCAYEDECVSFADGDETPTDSVCIRPM